MNSDSLLDNENLTKLHKGSKSPDSHLFYRFRINIDILLHAHILHALISSRKKIQTALSDILSFISAHSGYYKKNYVYRQLP